MIGFSLYNFFLCLFVFTALTALFVFLIFYIAKLRAYVISKGGEDKRIKTEIAKKIKNTSSAGRKVLHIAHNAISVALCALLCVVFLVSCVSGLTESAVFGGSSWLQKIPTVKVIASTSMSAKYEKNQYLFENNLNNQLQLFDLIVVQPLPPEDEIELYDVVVYEHITGTLLVHRVVGIEAPNEKHPGEWYFLLQGDAVHSPDTYPVRYNQMRGIYEGARVPNVGSFVYFMQSPAGVLCLILIAVTMIVTPLAERWLEGKEYDRVVALVAEGELDGSALSLYRMHEKNTIKDQDAACAQGADDDD